jgi:Ca2+-binding EF-hand superfamily protein
MKSFAVLSLTGLIALSTLLHAEDAAKPKKTFEEKFAQQDTDGNGTLSLDEYKAKKMARMDRKFTEANDPEKEMKLERQAGKQAKLFAAADTDGDGAISLEEYTVQQEQMAAKKAKKAAQ